MELFFAHHDVQDARQSKAETEQATLRAVNGVQTAFRRSWAVLFDWQELHRQMAQGFAREVAGSFALLQ